MSFSYCGYNGGPAKAVPHPTAAASKPLTAKPLRIAKPKLISHEQPCKHGNCKKVKELLTEVCRKLENVKEERDMMQQMARVERWVNGHTDFTELKLLQWYDFSACPKTYIDIKE